MSYAADTLAANVGSVLNETSVRLLLAAVGLAECAGRNTHVAPEYASKMAVVGKSTFQRYLGERDIRRDESSAGVVDPKAPHIFAERLAVRSPEAACQMDWMHPRHLCGPGQGHGFSIARMQERKDLFHPGEAS